MAGIRSCEQTNARALGEKYAKCARLQHIIAFMRMATPHPKDRAISGPHCPSLPRLVSHHLDSILVYHVARTTTPDPIIAAMNTNNKIRLAFVVVGAVLYQVFPKDLLFTFLGVGRTVQPISDFPYQCRRVHDPRLQHARTCGCQNRHGSCSWPVLTRRLGRSGCQSKTASNFTE